MTTAVEKELEVHPAANIFPLDSGSLDDLTSDIQRHGLLVKIETLDGKIIDGRRRYQACRKVGVEPEFREVSVADPIAYVVSLNLHRRHLTPSQRAMAAARAKELGERFRQEAKERQTESAARGGKSSGATRRGETKVPADRPEPSTGEAREQLGELFGVGGRTVSSAARVVQLAEPEIVEAVDEGRMGVTTAAVLATESPEKQREEAARPRRNGHSTAKPAEIENEEEKSPEEPREVKGVGVFRAHEAINALTRIPKNDALREQGFRLVFKWMKKNK